MKQDLAQLFVGGVGLGLIVCVVGICLCGLYALGSLAWDLWGRHLLPSRPLRLEATSPHLVDAEAEGWLDDDVEWGFPVRTVDWSTGPIEVVDEIHHWSGEEAERRFAQLRDLEVA